MKARFIVIAALLLGAPAAAEEPFSGCPADRPADAAPALFHDLGGIFNWLDGRFCARGSYGMSGWTGRELTPPQERTADFDAVYAAVKNGTAGPMPAHAGDYVYLVVKGLYGNHLPGYMEANEHRLQSLGLDARMVDIATEASTEENAKTLRDAILTASAGGKQVVVVGHSKGGMDTTTALSLYPELVPHVRGVVTIQSPYGGTPIATDVQDCPQFKQLTDAWVRDVWGGSPESMIDLTYANRRAFITAHPYPASQVPTIALATSRRVEIGSVMKSGVFYMSQRYGLESDGLVPEYDAEIPGADIVHLDDMDHAEGGLVGVPGLRRHSPADVTEALVRVLLASPASNR